MKVPAALVDLADDGCPSVSTTGLLRRMFDAAVRSASPSSCLPPHLPEPPSGRTVVIGAGKAAAAMAHAVEENWSGDLSGLVVTRHGHGAPSGRVEIVEAGHPVPDEAGLMATNRMVALLEDLTGDDLVLCLLSGGGSALLCAPLAGMTLSDDVAITRALLRSGAAIGEMNCVRKHLSSVKGGRLAALVAPARLVTLAISDVPGDDPSDIASGPTVADPTTREDALDVLRRYAIDLPDHVRMVLEQAAETPKPGELGEVDYRLVATPQRALEAAARVAEAAGYGALILGDSIEGEAREVAVVHAGIARQVRRHGQPIAAPCVLLSGGETTVTVRGDGRGGRNVEFLLSLAVALAGEPDVVALAADTDGIDGTEDNAGAIITASTLDEARRQSMDARAFLARNDGYGFFDRLGALVATGPTMTNVNDFRAIIVDRAAAPLKG